MLQLSGKHSGMWIPFEREADLFGAAVHCHMTAAGMCSQPEQA